MTWNRLRRTLKRWRSSRRGMVLLVVLVVVMMLVLGAYAYVALMRSHRESSVQTNRQLQAKLMVDSGVDVVRTFLLQPPDAQLDAGGRYNNPSFKQLPVIDDLDPQQRGYVTIVAPALDDSGNLAGVRFGLEDESGRLNLNTLLVFEQQLGGAPESSGSGQPAGPMANTATLLAASQALSGGSSGTYQTAASSDSARGLLMALPGMTADVADAILDWLDEDDEAREYGAESPYYSSLEPPYAPKNGPLDTVEELLRVRGVTPQLLFGSDTNRNGQIDPNEGQGAQSAFDPNGSLANSPDTMASTGEAGVSSGSLDRGWSSYLTLHSRERNLTPDGQPRIYLNNPDLKMLHEELSQVFPEDWATFIVAYRQGGPYTAAANTSTNPPQSAKGHQIDFNLKSKTKFTQALDLIGVQTRVKFSGEQQAIVVESPFRSDIGSMNAYMGMLMDYVTVNPAATVPGRLNINQAPAALLRGIPGIDDDIVDQILSMRTAELTPEKPNRRHETWLLTEAVVDLTKMKLLQPFINCGGHVHRAQIVGYYQSGEAASRAEAIFDATGLLPRVVLWREMSHLGRGYALETLGIDYSE